PVERAAIAGVGIDDQIGIDAITDHPDGLDDLAHADETDVRSGEPRIRDRCTGDIERREAALFGDQGGECIIDAGSDYDRLSPEAGTQVRRLAPFPRPAIAPVR